MATSNTDTTELPKSLRLLQKYNFTDEIETTAPSMPSDFFIRLSSIPGDLLVPGLVFFALRDVNAEILHIGQTISGPPAVTGVIDRDRLAAPETKTIDDIAALPRTIDIHRTEDENLTELEVVHEQRKSAKLVGSTLSRTIDATGFEILNVQNHGHRSGVSVYLSDPDSPSDCDIDDRKTLADLLTS
ncbi:hypothetical protein C471_07586 [Halorubrum saccharovorum DSM 1137]|uniref:Uncharacterized protein n=1 Tax=Halorubrum saccharovorum DSM 1137 TaxID=1227484 RepID=M0E107_9EURY|nr:hypothetical protein [Halorubrum saccharovorum]ELZ40627.1 hypothetical protein C471_07586 [Halorubrum saccharovorum DSM 1137]